MHPRRVAVAVSGGRDSLALLHATLRAARDAEVVVAALHVHHGLQPQADAWLAALQSRCARWARAGAPLVFSWRRLAGQPARGESVEAWARKGRYAALAEMAQEADAPLVLLAHHQRDQAETFVLQALRGGGAAGLSAMPREATRGGVTWARPWLDMPRESIEAYVRRHRLRHVDDDSNDEPRFARNRLRLQVWPSLLAAFPDAEASLSAAARRAQQDAACLQELADADLAAVEEGGALVLARWLLLSPARRANALRAWLRRHSGHGGSLALIDRLMDELPRSGGPARWQAEGFELRRYRGRLFCAPVWAETAVEEAVMVRIDAPGRYAVPGWRGCLCVDWVDEGGVALALLGCTRLQVRRGGEQFQRGARGMPRALKKQYQAAGVATWDRSGPLLYAGDRLVFVPGLGIDARAIADTGEPQVSLKWAPDDLGAQPRETP